MPTCKTGVLVEINEEISCDDSVRILLKLAWIHRNVYDPGKIQKYLYGDIKALNCLCPPPPPGLPVCTNTLFHWMHFSHRYF